MDQTIFDGAIEMSYTGTSPGIPCHSPPIKAVVGTALATRVYTECSEHLKGFMCWKSGVLEQPRCTERSKARKITNTFGQYLLVKLVTNVPAH